LLQLESSVTSNLQSRIKSDTKYVEIPLNIQELKNKEINVAIEWRMKTRNLFDEYIEKQKLVRINFVHDQINQKGIYIFKRGL